MEGNCSDIQVDIHASALCRKYGSEIRARGKQHVNRFAPQRERYSSKDVVNSLASSAFPLTSDTATEYMSRIMPRQKSAVPICQVHAHGYTMKSP